MSRERPNILLIVVDCARADKWLGPDRPTRTPNLDRLAAQSVALPTCIVEKSCTTPGFATLLTARYSPRHGVHLVWGYRLPQRVPMLTETLAAAGYHTYAEVTGPLLPGSGLERGFQSYRYRAPCDYLHTAWGDGFVRRLRQGGYREPWFILLHVWELHPQRRVDPAFDLPAFGRDAYERAISSLDAHWPRLLEAAGDDAVIVFTGDHGEKTAFERYPADSAVEYSRRLLGIDRATGMTPFSVARWAGPAVLQELYGACTPRLRQMRVSELRRRIDFSPRARWRDRLRLLWLTPMLFLHDLAALGAPLRLTRMLHRRGLLDPIRARRRVELLAQRVGAERLFDMHLRMWINSYRVNYHEGHMVHVYDYLVRVPLLIRWPGRLPAGVTCRTMVRQPDILPTLLDLLGLEPQAGGGQDGRSLRPLLEGGRYDPPPAYVSVSGCPQDLELRGVRTERFKYTYGPFNDALPQELYDLRADPGETTNLAGQQPQRCRELRAVADQIAAGSGPAPEELTLDPDAQPQIEQRLRELGYID